LRKQGKQVIDINLARIDAAVFAAFFIVKGKEMKNDSPV